MRIPHQTTRTRRKFIPMSASHPKIAVVGYSCILPGGENVQEGWELIRDGLDHISELPNNRIDVAAYYDSNKKAKDKIYCKRGGFIPDFKFCPRDYALNMLQLEDCDANQVVSLLKVREAMEHAGIAPFTKEKKNIGCVLGIGGGMKASHEFYSRMNYVVVEKVLRKVGMKEEDVQNIVHKYKESFPEWRLDSFPGFLGNVVAGRCTNVFNLNGMNCVVDAACASSLTAMKVAVDELVRGDCRTMITGATCTDNSIGMFMSFSKTPVFSTAQSVTAYDKDTKGMLIGEGSVMFVLKRLEHALEDNDTVHAVLRSCSSSSDGKASGIYSPTEAGQVLCMERAYAAAQVDPKDVTMVEGHGTGTLVGDITELNGIKTVFRGAAPESVAVGSVKSQIGHLKACAGAAGLLKVILALRHKTIPRSINMTTPPEPVRICESSLFINNRLRPWFGDPDKPRIAGVSSFGFGGSNYHCVVEEFEAEHTKPYRLHRVPEALVLDAATPQELLALVRDTLATVDQVLAADTTITQRHLFADLVRRYGLRPVAAARARVAFVALDAQELQEVLRKTVRAIETGAKVPDVFYRAHGIATEGAVASLFTGQGSQYTNMFDEVATNWPPMRAAVTAMDRATKRQLGALVSSKLYRRDAYGDEAKEEQEPLTATEWSQAATTACSAGLYDIFAAAGLRSDFAAGHSLGEFGALRAAGCVDNETLCDLVAIRGDIMRQPSPSSAQEAMTVVIGPSACDVQVEHPDVVVANYNSSTQVVLSGHRAGIEAEEARLRDRGFRVVRLESVSGAFHSKYMRDKATAFDARMRQTMMQPSRTTKVFSNVTALEYPASPDQCKALFTRHMHSPVRFRDQVCHMYDAGARVFVEFGPRGVLSKFVHDILDDKPDVHVVPVHASAKKSSERQLRLAAAQLTAIGVPLRNFDPWAAPLPIPMPRRGEIQLSACTYVSKKTLRNRDQALNDGYQVQYDSGESKTDQATIATQAAEISVLRHQLTEATQALSAAAPVAAPAAASADVMANATQTVMSVIAEKTGYEDDMVTADLNLEDDLGIDSIKRVEILSDVQERLSLTVTDTAALAATRTVGDVIQFMEGELAATAWPAAIAVSGGADTGTPIDWGVTVSRVGRRAWEGRERVVVDYTRVKVLVVGTAWCASVEKVLREQGCRVRWVRSAAEVDVAADGDACGVVCCVGHGEAGASGVGVKDVFLLAGKLGKRMNAGHEGLRPFFVTVARTGGGDMSGAALLAGAEQRSLAGLVKTLDLEWEHVYCRAMDCGDADDCRIGEMVWDEIHCPDAREREVAYTGSGTGAGSRGEREAMDVVPVVLRESHECTVSGDEHFLVTGGARGITPHCLEALARRVRHVGGSATGCRFTLVGRSEVQAAPAWAAGKNSDALRAAALAHLKASGERVSPKVHKALVARVVAGRDIRGTLETLRAAGATVAYEVCDITSPESVRALGRRVGASGVTSLIHASGVIRDKRIENKTGADFDLVYGTKVVGLRHVMETFFSAHAPRHLVMFSSIASVQGNIGQADYAMANEVLNSFAAAYGRAHPETRAHALCFGPWESGMVTPALKAMFQERGIEIISRAEGGSLVAHLISATEPGQYMVGNWGREPQPQSCGRVEITKRIRAEDLRGHRIQGKLVYPLCFAMAEGVEMLLRQNPGHQLRNIRECRLLGGISFAAGDADVEATFVASRRGDEFFCRWNVGSKPAYEFNVTMGAPAGTAATAVSRRDVPTHLPRSHVYDTDVLFHTGPFAVLQGLSADASQAKVVCEHPSATTVDGVLLDACFQQAIAVLRHRHGHLSLPTFGEVRVHPGFWTHGSGCRVAYSHMRPLSATGTTQRLEATVTDEHGVVLLTVETGMVLSKTLRW